MQGKCEYLWIALAPFDVRFEQMTEVLGPRSDSSDVKTETLLVRGGGQGERVIFGFPELRAGNTHPLARVVVEAEWPFEYQVYHP